MASASYSRSYPAGKTEHHAAQRCLPSLYHIDKGAVTRRHFKGVDFVQRTAVKTGVHMLIIHAEASNKRLTVFSDMSSSLNSISFARAAPEASLWLSHQILKPAHRDQTIGGQHRRSAL